MVDLISRPDRYDDQGPDLDSVNGLIQARIDGAISRRQLMKRAAPARHRRPGDQRDAARHLGHGLWRAFPGTRSQRRDVRARASRRCRSRDRPRQKALHRRAAPHDLARTSEPDTLHPYLTQLVAGYDIIDRNLRWAAALRQHPATESRTCRVVRDLRRRTDVHIHAARGREVPQRRCIRAPGRHRLLENAHEPGVRCDFEPRAGTGSPTSPRPMKTPWS